MVRNHLAAGGSGAACAGTHVSHRLDWLYLETEIACALVPRVVFGVHQVAHKRSSCMQIPVLDNLWPRPLSMCQRLLEASSAWLGNVARIGTLLPC